MNKPFPLTAEEIKEIASLRQIHKTYGANDESEMESILEGLYIVKFDFSSSNPNYTGDLILIQSDFLDGDIPVVRLIRNGANKLEMLI